MARPSKKGLDYFPYDVYFDDKFEMLQAVYESNYKHAAKSIVVGVISLIWQEIYSGGYFKKWDERKSIIFASKCGITIEEFQLILNTALNEGIFNECLYEKYNILTSCGIQKRYFTAITDRTGIEIIYEYLLISVPQKIINNPKNEIISLDNSNNRADNPQKKLKENKVNKIKESKSDKPTKHKYGKYKNVLLTDDEVEKLKEKYSDFQERLDYFSSRLEMKGYKYKSHYLAFLSWNKEDKNTSSFSLEEIKAKINKFD